MQGTAAMIWIRVWLQLRKMGLWSDDEIILRAASFYRVAAEAGEIYGAPEDIGECTSSEDTYIALGVYADCYEAFNRPEDLETAIQVGKWIYLWRKSFNIDLPEKTMMRRYDLKSRGGDSASPKNNHLHVYGLDAELSLIQLEKWTGDSRWGQLAEDHWNFSRALLVQEDGQYNGYRGMLSEQYYFIDWAPLGNSVHRFEKDQNRSFWNVGPHFRNQGNVMGFSTAWCVAFVLSAAVRRIDVKK
jgi:hypothetical protein